MFKTRRHTPPPRTPKNNRKTPDFCFFGWPPIVRTQLLRRQRRMLLKATGQSSTGGYPEREIEARAQCAR